MLFADLPIQKKLMRGINLISGVVLLVTCTTFFSYEFYKFRQTSTEKLSTIGKIVSANGTAALAFANHDDAQEILASLKSEPNIVAACFYDEKGNLFSQYPANLGADAFPVKPEEAGYRFSSSHLEGFEPVMQGSQRLGTLYLKSDLGAIYERFQLYGIITAFVIAISLLLAYLLSRTLQNTITKPILALSETSKIVSDQRDYSVRAVKLGNDELGSLTDAFNQMLAQIEEQNKTLSEFNQKLERKVTERTRELESANKKLELHATKLKESEEQIQTIFRSAPDAVIVIDEAGKIVRWNPRAEIIFGWTAKEVIGKSLFDKIIPDRFRETQKQEIKQFIKARNGTALNKSLELLAIRKDLTEFDAGINISPTILNGKYYFIGFVSDITFRKNAEATIKQKSEELAYSNKELGDFAYIVSHDLKAPLRAIASLSNFLEEDFGDKLGKTGKQQLNLLVGRVHRMNNLIEGILDYSRLRPDKSKAGIVNLNHVLKEVKELIGSPGNIEIKIENPLPTIMFDQTKIEQVFQNLVGNAIKYMDKPKGIIRIGSSIEDNFWKFYVADNGPGIDERYFDKIFQIFQTLTARDERESTGIGLAIVKKIIDTNGGRIWVESQLNEGTTFYFTLPMN